MSLHGRYILQVQMDLSPRKVSECVLASCRVTTVPDGKTSEVTLALAGQLCDFWTSSLKLTEYLLPSLYSGSKRCLHGPSVGA